MAFEIAPGRSLLMKRVRELEAADRKASKAKEKAEVPAPAPPKKPAPKKAPAKKKGGRK